MSLSTDISRACSRVGKLLRGAPSNLVRARHAVQFVAGANPATSAMTAMAALECVEIFATSLVGGVAKAEVVRVLKAGELPPAGSEVKIGNGGWVPYTGQALPA